MYFWPIDTPMCIMVTASHPVILTSSMGMVTTRIVNCGLWVHWGLNDNYYDHLHVNQTLCTLSIGMQYLTQGCTFCYNYRFEQTLPYGMHSAQTPAINWITGLNWTDLVTSSRPLWDWFIGKCCILKQKTGRGIKSGNLVVQVTTAKLTDA